MKQKILSILLLIFGIGLIIVGFLWGVDLIGFFLFTFGFLDPTKNIFHDFIGDMSLILGMILIIFGVSLKRNESIIDER